MGLQLAEKAGNNNIEVRLGGNDEERRQVYRTRYAVYADEMGWKTRYADDQRGTLTDPLDQTGKIFAAFCGNEVVGTLRTNYGDPARLGEYVDLYEMGCHLRANPRGAGIGTMFMVRRSFRSSLVPSQLLVVALREAVANGVETVFIDCERRMVPFYRRLGLHVHIESICHPEYGEGVCMAGALKDIRLLWNRCAPQRPVAA